MARPDLTPAPASSAVDDFYDALPQHYRDADEDLGWPLYRWLAGPLAVYADLVALRDAIDYVPPADGGEPGDTSSLADPRVAPLDWLPWLAQLIGVPLPPGLSETEARDAVAFASAGWRAGSKAAVLDAARSELTGTRFVTLFDHSVTNPGDGGQWDVLLVTRSTETPDAAAVLLAVDRRGAKPAGVVLHHRTYEAAWDTVSAEYPTWDAITGPWNRIEEAGL